MLKRAAVATASLLFVLALIVQGCSTDVDLAAPYKSTPVIVGVLDYTVDTQYFRINRTFLTNGDPTTYAALRDSIEYADGEVDAWLIKYNGNDIVDSIQLFPIDLPSRDPGAFYNVDVRFFYTAEPLFTASEIQNILSMSYALRATLRGVTYRASTDFPRLIPSDISTPSPNFPQPPRVQFVSLGVPINVNFRYSVHSSGARYQGDLVLVYDEELQDGTIALNKELIYPLGNFNTQTTSSSGTSRTFDFNAGLWFNFVGNYFRQVPNLKKVRIHHTAYRLTVANNDLNAYYSVSQPVSQFVPVFANFSNIDNDAIGILGAKNQLNRLGWLNEPSIAYLTNGQGNSGVCYCVYWTGSIYTCDLSATGCP